MSDTATLPAASAPPAETPVRDTASMGWWLLGCAAMVFVMVVIGGITRVTHSGLSMVEWKPLIGILPPLSDIEWQRVFGLYQQSPEYRQINQGMSLAEFQGIFWWEWFHRLFGHLIGLAFALPFLWFLIRRRVSRPLLPRLIGLFLLGGLQGVVGWLMVASGLVDRPAVSHYRLAAHLATAGLIYGCLIWEALDLLRPQVASGFSRAAPRLRTHLCIALGLSVMTLIWGALVAGLHAGLIYNTFPLMNGSVLPEDAWFLVPAWINVFENASLVQFCHRWLAITTAVVTVAYWLRVRGVPDTGGLAPSTRRIAALLAGMVLIQMSLGISTLLLAVPLLLAVTHQAGAFVVVALIIWGVHDLRARPASR